MEYGQHRNDHQCCQHQAVADHKARFFLDLHAQHIAKGRQGDAEKGRGRQLRHHRFPLSIHRMVSRTAHTVTAKVTTVDTKQITTSATRLLRSTSV